MKNVFKITFFIMLALVLLFVAIVATSALSFVNSHSESIGIIGGADGPTAVFVTQTLIFETPVFWVLCFVAVLLIVSAIGWLATKNK